MIGPALALLPEATLLVQGDGVIRLANPRAGQVLALAPEALPGRALREFVAEDAGGLAEYLRICARSSALTPGALTIVQPPSGRMPYRCEGGLVQPRSGDAPALLLLRLVPKEAAVNRFVALNLRIEELGKEIVRRQRAEAALREKSELLEVTLASIGDAVIATDAQGRVTFMNGVAAAYTGWTPEAGGGRPLDEVFVIRNEVTGQPAESPVPRVLREGAVVGLANHTVLVAKDGSTRPIDDAAAPIRDVKGRVLGTVLVFRDVTERRALERERAESDRRKDEFIAMLAHELRNPLAVLHSGVEVLRLRPPEPALLQAMGRQVRQLARLVDDLLDVSRITTGKIFVERSPLPLATVLEHAVESVRPFLDARQVDLVVEAPPASLIVEADLARLSQVFGNLLSNAAKFSEPGARVVVAAGAEEGHAVVRVRDSGIGMAPELLPAIFDLFTQADQSLARSRGGLGVGLSVARRITELHRGTIEARSDGPGRGSEFVVRLPLMQNAGAQEVSVPPAPPKVRPRRILIVDDSADAAGTLAALLAMSGHQARTAHDGSQALALAAEFRPDVVLLDLGLPGMDGFEVARRLRASPDTRAARIIAVSGYGALGDRAGTGGSGFDELLTKPVPLERLEKILAR